MQQGYAVRSPQCWPAGVPRRALLATVFGGMGVFIGTTPNAGVGLYSRGRPENHSRNEWLIEFRLVSFVVLGSVRTEVVRFVGCGGLATSLAPGRGTYRLVRSAAFQACKDRRKILKWRHMRAFSGSVSEWCGRADAARLLPQQPPSGRAAAGRTQAAAAPAAAPSRPGNRQPAWRRGSSRHPRSRLCPTSVRRHLRPRRRGRSPGRRAGSRSRGRAA